MMVLTRKIGEKIVIQSPEGEIWVTVAAVSGGKVRLGIEAPKRVTVHRSEVYEAIQAELGGEG